MKNIDNDAINFVSRMLKYHKTYTEELSKNFSKKNTIVSDYYYVLSKEKMINDYFMNVRNHPEYFYDINMTDLNSLFYIIFTVLLNVYTNNEFSRVKENYIQLNGSNKQQLMCMLKIGKSFSCIPSYTMTIVHKNEFNRDSSNIGYISFVLSDLHTDFNDLVLGNNSIETLDNLKNYIKNEYETSNYVLANSSISNDKVTTFTVNVFNKCKLELFNYDAGFNNNFEKVKSPLLNCNTFRTSRPLIVDYDNFHAKRLVAIVKNILFNISIGEKYEFLYYDNEFIKEYFYCDGVMDNLKLYPFMKSTLGCYNVNKKGDII